MKHFFEIRSPKLVTYGIERLPNRENILESNTIKQLYTHNISTLVAINRPLVVNVMEVQGARVSGVGKFLDLKTSMAETEECLGCLGNSMYFRPVLNRL